MNSASHPVSWTVRVPDENAVADLATRFARWARPPLVVFLEGDLGAGKTTFARAFIQALGYDGHVKSPSYGLLEAYQAGGFDILHLDLYRIEDPEELDYLAIRDLFTARTVLLVEWPARGASHLPEADLLLKFDEDEQSRTISFRSFTRNGENLALKIHSNDK